MPCRPAGLRQPEHHNRHHPTRLRQSPTASLRWTRPDGSGGLGVRRMIRVDVSVPNQCFSAPEALPRIASETGIDAKPTPDAQSSAAANMPKSAVKTTKLHDARLHQGKVNPRNCASYSARRCRCWYQSMAISHTKGPGPRRRAPRNQQLCLTWNANGQSLRNARILLLSRYPPSHCGVNLFRDDFHSDRHIGRVGRLPQQFRKHWPKVRFFLAVNHVSCQTAPRYSGLALRRRQALPTEWITSDPGT